MSILSESQDIRLKRFEQYLIKTQKAPATIEAYLFHAKKYFRDLETDDLSEIRIAYYLKLLEKVGITTSYRRIVLYALKSCAKANKLPWKEGEFLFYPKSGPGERIKQVVIDRNDLGNLITFARNNKDAGYGHLFLSSLYGMRQIEMNALKPEHIKKEKETIYIYRAKGGLSRDYFLPANLVRFIDLDFKPKSRAWMHEYFKTLCNLAGVKKEEGMGWHSIRRSLVTELNKIFDPLIVEKFIGWKPRQMVARYNVPDCIELDKKIMNSHPFLHYWT